MPSVRIPTVTLERHLLHYLLTNKAVLQSRLSGCKRKWFTNDARTWIYSFISKSFEESRCLLSETQFDFFLDSTFPDEDGKARRLDVKAEYDSIIACHPQDEIDVIIDRLNEATLATATEELLLSAYASLQQGDVEDALSKLKQGSLDLRKPRDTSRVVSLWEEMQEWKQEVCNRRDFPEKYAGIPTGFEKFDKMTGGLFPAELTVIFGLSGKGKSTLMKQIGVNVRKAGYNVLHCGNEEDEFQMQTKYISVETGVKYHSWKWGKFTEEEMQLLEDYEKEQQDEKAGKLYIYNFPQQTDATMIERQLAELQARGVKIDLVIVDYLDLMSSIKRAYNENDEGGRVTGDLKQIAINFHVPVLVCTQANQTVEKQEMKERPFLTASDVFGTKRKVHSANTLVGIVNQTATVGAGERDPSETKRHRLVICVPKNRDGGIFTFRLIIEVETGRIVPDDEDDPYGQKQEEQAKGLMDEYSQMEERSQNEATVQDRSDLERKKAKMLESRVEQIMQSIPENKRETSLNVPSTALTEPIDESEYSSHIPSTMLTEPRDESTSQEMHGSIMSLLKSRRKK